MTKVVTGISRLFVLGEIKRQIKTFFSQDTLLSDNLFLYSFLSLTQLHSRLTNLQYAYKANIQEWPSSHYT
jgi:hypothetical protein